MMKKFLSIMLAALLLVGLLAGCGVQSGGNSDGKTTTAANEDVKTDWDYVSAKGELVIGYTVYAPMNYEENGKWVGFDTEYAEAVCEKLGVTPKFLEIKWDTKEVDLAAKKMDCVWNGFTITEEREEKLDFTSPYIKNRQVIIVRKADVAKYTTTASLANAKLTAEKASTGEKAIQEDDNLKQATYVESDVQTSALMAVKALTSDACVVDYTVAMANVGKGDYADLAIVEGVELSVEEYGIGFRTDSDIVAKVNQATNELRADGTLETLAKKYGLEAILIK